METKPSNPKDAIGIKKVPMSCLSGYVVTSIAHVFEIDNLTEYYNQEVKLSEHINIALMHLINFWEGFKPLSKISLLSYVMARLFVLRHAELEGRLINDIGREQGLHVKELNAQAANIIEKYPDCKDPFTHLPMGSIGAQLIPPTIPAPLHKLPWRVILEMALGMMEGARKYGRHNYRSAGVRASVYYDATIRHIGDAIEGTTIDKDSGLSHLTKALSSTHVLHDSMFMGNWIDDRPIKITQEQAYELITLSTCERWRPLYSGHIIDEGKCSNCWNKPECDKVWDAGEQQ